MFILTLGTCFAQELTNADQLVISEKNFEFLSYTIKIIQYKRNKPVPEDYPHFCTSEIHIISNNAVINIIQFKDIEPVGWHFGVFLPKSQELKSHFILFKYGDYDCRTIIVDNNGKTHNLGGGDYSIYKNKYLIMRHHQDGIIGFTIFNLLENQISFTTKEDGALVNLYLYNSNLYYKWIKYEYLGADAWETKIRHYKINLKSNSAELTEPFDVIFNNENIYKIDISNIELTNDCYCQ